MTRYRYSLHDLRDNKHIIAVSNRKTKKRWNKPTQRCIERVNCRRVPQSVKAERCRFLENAPGNSGFCDDWDFQSGWYLSTAGKLMAGKFHPDFKKTEAMDFFANVNHTILLDNSKCATSFLPFFPVLNVETTSKPVKREATNSLDLRNCASVCVNTCKAGNLFEWKKSWTPSLIFVSRFGAWEETCSRITTSWNLIFW